VAGPVEIPVGTHSLTHSLTHSPRTRPLSEVFFCESKVEEARNT
jgi:hypothetical protein